MSHEVDISYKGSSIATMDASGTKTLLTEGKYCEDDIEVVYTRPAAPSPTLETVTKSYTPTESQQTETITASSGYDGIEEVDVTVGAISSTYVGSGITQRSSLDLSASGATVTAPSGYYENDASKAVASGSRGNSTVYVSTKTTEQWYTVKHDNATSGYYDASSLKTDGTVILTRQQETVTPTTSSQSVTPTGSTYYLDSVTVNPIPSQYIVPSGNKAITQNGNNIDVTNYATVSVNVAGGGLVSQDENGYVVLAPTGSAPVLKTKSITANGTYNASSDNASGYSQVTVNVAGGTINVSTDFTISNQDYKLTFNNIQSAPSAFFLLFDNDSNNYGIWINNHCVTSISYDGTTTTALAIGDTTSYSYTQQYYTFASGELTWSYSNSQHKLTFNIDTNLSYFFDSNSDSNWGYKLYYV